MAGPRARMKALMLWRVWGPGWWGSLEAYQLTEALAQMGAQAFLVLLQAGQPWWGHCSQHPQPDLSISSSQSRPPPQALLGRGSGQAFLSSLWRQVEVAERASASTAAPCLSLGTLSCACASLLGSPQRRPCLDPLCCWGVSAQHWQESPRHCPWWPLPCERGQRKERQ